MIESYLSLIAHQSFGDGINLSLSVMRHTQFREKRTIQDGKQAIPQYQRILSHDSQQSIQFILPLRAQRHIPEPSNRAVPDSLLISFAAEPAPIVAIAGDISSFFVVIQKSIRFELGKDERKNDRKYCRLRPEPLKERNEQRRKIAQKKEERRSMID